MILFIVAILAAVLLPAAASAIVSAVLLGAARAIGETMAVLMVTGNVARLPSSLFDPVRTLTANIALELGYALDLHRSALFVGGLGLLALVMVLMLITGSVSSGHSLSGSQGGRTA